MPTAAPKPCSECGVLVHGALGRCPAHRVRAGQWADSRRGSRQARSYGAEWDRKRLAVIARDDGLCQPCLREERVTRGDEVDHIVNKAEWRRRHGTLCGVDADINLQTNCRACHQAKTQVEA